MDAESGGGTAVAAPRSLWGVALLACSCTLLLAYAHPSLSGSIFLLCFLAWGAVCLPAPSLARYYRTNQAVWLAVTLLASAFLCVQVVVQLLYSTDRIPVGEDEWMDQVLAACGFPPLESLPTVQIVSMFVGPLACMTTSVQATLTARHALAALRSAPLHTISSTRGDAPIQLSAAPGMPVPFMMGLLYSNAGIFVAMLVLAAGLLWPSVLCLPYLLVVCWGLWRWGRERPCWVSSPLVRLLQLYTGLHLLLLYLWQVPLLHMKELELPARALGVYELEFSCEADSSNGCKTVLAAQIVHFVSLHLLFVALGAYLSLTQQPLYRRLQHEASKRPQEGGARWWLLTSDQAGYEPLLSTASAESPVAGSPRPWASTAGSDAGTTGPWLPPMALGARSESAGRSSGDAGAVQEQPSARAAGRSANGTNWRPVESFIAEAPVGGPIAGMQATGVHSDTAAAGSPAAPDTQQPQQSVPAPRGRQESEPGAAPPTLRWQQARLLLEVLLPFLVSSVEYMLEELLASPSVAAIAIAAFSMVHVSLLGNVMLLVALLVLLAPTRYGKVALEACSPFITAFYMLWLLDAYVATALHDIIHPPDVLSSIGIWGYGKPPPALLPLLLHLLTVAAVAGLSRAHSRSRGRGPPPARELRQLFGARDRLAGASPAPGQGQVASPASGWQGPFQEDEAADEARLWWRNLGIGLVQVLWYMGHILVPLSWFLLGIAHLDVLHGMYLLAMLLYFASADMRLYPPPPKAPSGGRPSALPAASYHHHWAMRLYGSLHLVVIYGAVVLQLPGLRTELSERVLRLVGLLDPSVLQDILPVLLVLLAATVHVALGKWLASQPPAGMDAVRNCGGLGAGTGRLVGPDAALAWLAKVHPPALWRLMRWLARGVVSTGLAMLALVGYLMVLYVTPLSLIGVAYMWLLLLVFLVPPSQHAYLQLLDALAVDGSRSQAMALAKAWRWLLLVLLSLLCIVDLTAQYVLVVSNLGQGHPLLPRNLAQWFRDVLGIDDAVEGRALALALARPAVLLAVQYVYRSLYSLGMLEMWRREHRLTEGELMARRLAKQGSFAWLIRRFLILHSDKLVALACFCAAMQQPSATGWLLVLALAALWVLMDSCAVSARARRLQAGAAVALEALISLWILLEYVYQVDWLRDMLLPKDDSRLADLLAWCGLPLLEVDGAAALEPVLRWKVLILVAVSVRTHAARWEEKLPPQVVAAAHRGEHCPLFWPPPSEDNTERRSGGPSGPAVGASVQPVDRMLLPIKALLLKVLRRVTSSANKVLRAMDLPEQEMPLRKHPVLLSLQRVKGALSRPSSVGQDMGAARHHRGRPHRVHLAAAINSLQCFLERFWDTWGMEVCMLTLLLAAFLSCNVLSLAYMALVGMGMVTKGPRRRWLWGHLVVPLLAVLLVLQYAIYVGPPPDLLPPASPAPPELPQPPTLTAAATEPSGFAALHSMLQAVSAPAPAAAPNGTAGPAPSPRGGDEPPYQPDPALLWRWLGLADVQPSSLWALFFAFAFCTMQAHRDACRAASPAAEGTKATGRRLQSGGKVISRAGGSDIRQPLLGSSYERSSQAGAASTLAGSSSQETQGTSTSGGPFAAAAQQTGSAVTGRAPGSSGGGSQEVTWAQHELEAEQSGADIEMARSRALQQQSWQQEGGQAGRWEASPSGSPYTNVAPPVPAASASSSGSAGRQGAPSVPHGTSRMHPQHGRHGHSGAFGAGSDAAGGDEDGDNGGATLFQPIHSRGQPRWSWLDWARYHAVKHSMDIVLVCMVAVCTYQKDVVHAGYLAIALLFFRQRSQLMVPGNRLFPWLPAFNFLVMLLMVAYQAPLELLLGRHWANSCELGVNSHCTVPHLLGFCKLCQWQRCDNGRYCVTLLFRHSGAMADVLLWVLLRLQARLYSSEIFSKVMAVMAEERAANAARAQHQRRAWYDRQARRALHTSRLRLARMLRISQLKSSLYHTDDIYEVPLPPAYLDAGLSGPGQPVSGGLGGGRGVESGRWGNGEGSGNGASGLNRGLSELGSGPAGGSGHRRQLSLGSARGASQGVPSALGRVPPALEQPHGSAGTAEESAGGGDAGAQPPADQPGVPPRPVAPPGLPRSRTGGANGSSRGGAVAAIAAEVSQLRHRRSVSDPSHLDSALAAARGTDDLALEQQQQQQQHQGPLASQWSLPLPEQQQQRPQQQHAEHHEQPMHGRKAAADGGGGRGGLLGVVGRAWRRLVRGSAWEAWLCYALFVWAFVTDFSLMTLVYPLSMVLVPLLAQDTVHTYWRVVLVYTEGVLILQYSYEVIAHCLCLSGGGDARPGAGAGPDAGCVWIFGDADALRRLDMLGLHASAVRTLPLFLVYLATLMYNYTLASTDPQAKDLAVSRASNGSLPHPPRHPGMAGTAMRGDKPGWVQHVTRWLLQLALEVWDHVRYVALPHERPPSWLKVDVGPPTPGHPAWDTQQSKELLQETLQTALDELRDKDMRARAARDGKSSRAGSSGRCDSSDASRGVGPAAAGGSGEGQDAAVSGLTGSGRQQEQAGAGGAGNDGSGGTRMAREQSLDWGDMGALGKIMQRSGGRHEQDKCHDDADEAEEGVPYGSIDLSTITRLVLRLDRVVPGDASLVPHGSASVLFEVLTEPPDYSRLGAEGLSVSALPPRRSTRPAHDAALAVLRLLRQLQAGHGDVNGGSGHPDAQQQQQAQQQQGQGQQQQQQAPEQPPHTDTSGGMEQEQSGTSPSSMQQEQHEDTGLAGLGEIQPALSGPEPTASHTAGGSEGSAADAQDKAATLNPSGSQSSLGSIPITAVEFHSRPPKDYYFGTALVDFLSFVYLALFYQVVMLGVRSLADITDERVLPWDYLSALILVFLIMVGDRVFYSLGSHLGKFSLFLVQLLVFIPTCMRLYWSPASGHTAHTHLRVFMLLKSISFMLNALQLRSGFPPRASFDGGGRQRFFFYAKPDALHQIGFVIFMAIPFMYELRTLLDWTCSATTLSWYQWLKLEDIRQSLYTEECRNMGRRNRKVGDRVPRYVKFLQGTLLFCLLLLAIWLPLLLFSSGAPTYQIPGVADARVNVSMGVITEFGDYQGVVRLPLFESGDRRSVQNYLASNASLPAALSGYTADQIKLLCVSQDSDWLWKITPPAQQALEAVLAEPNVAISFGWAITRTAPLASPKGGGPLCQAEVPVRLAGESRLQLLEVLRGERFSTRLMALNSSDPDGWRPGRSGPAGLYPVAWRLRSEQCAVRMGFDLDGRGRGGDGVAGWATQSVGCNVSLHSAEPGRDLWWRFRCKAVAEDEEEHRDDTDDEEEHWQAAADEVLAGRGAGGSDADSTQGSTSADGSDGRVAGGSDASGGVGSKRRGRKRRRRGGGDAPDHAECDASVGGPFLVAVLERVQSGLLGATLSSMGITGLYITFVYGISRFLRLTFTNIRLKIPFEDFPSTRRLVALVQDIYLARAECELQLEEELFYLLIKVYKTPRLLQELTKKEHED